MATLVKEKRRDKKKTKDKQQNKNAMQSELDSIANDLTILEEPSASHNVVNITAKPLERPESPRASSSNITESSTEQCKHESNIEATEDALLLSEQIVQNIDESNSVLNSCTQVNTVTKTLENNNLVQYEDLRSSGETYTDISNRLQIMHIPTDIRDLDANELKRLDHPDAYINTDQSIVPKDELILDRAMEESSAPSAPIFEELETSQPIHEEVKEVVIERKPKTKCMPLEEAVRMFGGTEIAEVKAMSEKEEAVVEMGPTSGPEHPLVDLLSTLRCSLMAVDRERTKLACGFVEEEKFRSNLWKVEKRRGEVSEKCSCGAKVELRATYEHAEFLKEKLPVAKMRLESLLRDVQDSYCHHQHSALLAHCQIEELISETVQGSKSDIREALSLILQALRLSDSGPSALSSALQRWAGALTAALLDGRDLRQLLFLLHHLFRQTRSVRWAARLVRVTVGDRGEAARAVAMLELLLTRPRLESALECTEDSEEVWVEVDRHGDGSAVSEGSLRERDLLALFHAVPLRDLVARIMMFTHSDVSRAREYEWRDVSGGRGVVRAACGTRALLATLQRAARAHPHYSRLLGALRALAGNVLHALAAMHLHNKSSYAIDLQERIEAELEACFALGYELLCAHAPEEMPGTLLRDDTAKDYCITYILALHDKTSKPIELLSVEMPVKSCEVRVRIIAQCSIDRLQDDELAKIVLEFLFQIGIKRKSLTCKGSCEAAARECLPRFLQAHPYLHTMAFHILADLNEAEPLDPSSVLPLSPQTWKPSGAELCSVLDDWSRRCPLLLEHLLLQLDYTPHVGLPLECQLAVGSWLCRWQQRAPAADAPEWSWRVLRRLRVHRTCWGVSFDAPPPEEEPTDLFTSAYAVLASAWGHCIPLICEYGLSALCRIASAGARARDAVHCLAPIMLVMTQSPESVALTPRFTELLSTLLGSGPSLVQRALGRGGPSGHALLLRLLLAQLERQLPSFPRSAIISAWLHALWRATLPAVACSLLDVAMLACRDWQQLDRHVTLLMQEENAKDYIAQIVRNAHCAPLVCESALRACHAQREAGTQLHARLLHCLQRQRAAGQKAHVDNALKQIGVNMSSEDLVIYRTASVVLTAPLQHPSHLSLWRTFFYLYLQRPPNMPQSTPPVGPLFFSGIIKSRTVAQLKKRLQETASYHHAEAETLKNEAHDDQPNRSRQSNTRIVRSKSATIDDCNLLPSLSIVDLTGESSESESDSLSEEESIREENREGIISQATDREEFHLLCYHVGAERLIHEYLRLLEDGENVSAVPHQTDIARFIPEQALDAAWKRELARQRPPSSSEDEEFPLPSDTPLPAPAQPDTPFQTVVNRIMSIKHRPWRRSRRLSIKSPVEDVNFKDSRSLLYLVDKHLKDIELLAREWSSELDRLSSLDSKLWELVSALRVRRWLAPVSKSCDNRCPPIMLCIKEQESCISTGAERGIKENRSSARAALRRLARPRPHAATTAAALHTIARRIRNTEAAKGVVERAWRCAGAATNCAPAQFALTALVTDLAERWLCHEGGVCASLLSRWGGAGGAGLQQALCGALVSPRRLRSTDWPLVYTALLRTALPSHAVFSYLSKFEISRWSETAEPTQRRDMLEALTTAAQRWGSKPDPEHHVLLELLGVHTTNLTSPQELCAQVMRCAHASAAGKLPPAHWAHVARAADTSAYDVPFDQLGHVLRDFGVLWWEVRTGVKGGKGTQYSAYAPHIAVVLHKLLRAFVAAALRLSYEPERVAWYAWSALQEAWAPWVSPHSNAAALLPSTGEDEVYTATLRHFVDNIHQVMLDCPGGEANLLQYTWQWTVHTYLSVNSGPGSQESRLQASGLLVELMKLLWTEHQWFSEKCLQTALQVCSSTDKEIRSWCGTVLNKMSVASCLRGVPDDQTAPTLAALLYLFTTLPLKRETLDEASRLPWWRLPEAALDDALQRFFAEYHSPARAYHDLPQFRIVLFASELALHSEALPPAVHRAHAHSKRLTAVSQCVRAACAPSLRRHAGAHAAALLDTLTQLAPYIEDSNELEELLSRAVIIMCVEPAAAAALPEWERWVQVAPRRAVLASLSAAAALTAFEYYAPLADAAAKAHMAHTDSTWSEVSSRWSSCPWREAGPLAARARLHAAYGASLAHAHTPRDLRTALLALLAADLNFVNSEVIIAVWICVACRVAREFVSGAGAEGAECAGAARSVLARWAQEPRLSILRMVAVRPAGDAPTARHRLLARFAQCVLDRSSEAVRAYQAACAAAPAAEVGDAAAWGEAPSPRRLPRLAIRLFPNAERYFKEELDMMADE